MMDIATDNLSLSTNGFTDIIDITADLDDLLRKSGFTEGSMLVFIPGATGGLTTVEYESGLIEDLEHFFERIIPMDSHYRHNERWHDGNGYAHIRAALLKPSLVIPYLDGKLCLGTWQQVIFIDFDNRPRNRNLVVQISGKRPS